MKLRDYQRDAVNRMKTGCILCGGMGSGKSLTALAYYYKQQGGDLDNESENNYMPMMDPPKDLYIITTARKRDTKEWEFDMAPFLLSTNAEANIYSNKVVVDSWNNISKYKDIEDSFFIFDEQRVVGTGEWTKSFLKIAKSNEWILLSATPGDTWSDYIPVFIANGFYKNRTQFNREHVIYSRFITKYPKIDRYVGTKRLERLRDRILINMDYERPAKLHFIDIYVDYDKVAYKELMKNRWNVEKDEPIETAAELCYELRKISNTHQSRLNKVYELAYERKKVIIFYNYDYELNMLREVFNDSVFEIGEWNGHKHQDIPNSEYWVYLVQYTAGAEGWNCLLTDTIIFFSQNYSYKTKVQSSGRIDRLNTPFTDLYFYDVKSHSNIDEAIAKALREKRKFNESRFISG